VLLEGDAFQFEKGLSPVELLYPDELKDVLERIGKTDRGASYEV